MKIMLISVKSEVSRGGIAVWTDRFLAKCAQLNIDCALVNTEIIGKRTSTGKRRLWDECIRTVRIFRKVRKLLKAESFDAVYLNTSCGSFGLFRDRWLAKMIRKQGIALITQYHCEIPYWVRRKASIKCLGHLAADSCRNLVLCRKSGDFLREQYGVDSIRIPNFVAESVVLTTEKPIAPQIARVCFVGRVSEAKGASELFAVARKFPKMTFELIGDVSQEVLTWEKPANVILFGAVSNEAVIARLDAADLFLFPSHTEGCSMALMEAMARGLPCVATDVGANADMLDGCGIIVEKHDVDAMAAAVRAWEDPVVRREKSRKCVEKVKEHYTDQNVDKIVALIGQL